MHGVHPSYSWLGPSSPLPTHLSPSAQNPDCQLLRHRKPQNTAVLIILCPANPNPGQLCPESLAIAHTAVSSQDRYPNRTWGEEWVAGIPTPFPHLLGSLNFTSLDLSFLFCESLIWWLEAFGAIRHLQLLGPGLALVICKYLSTP